MYPWLIQFRLPRMRITINALNLNILRVFVGQYSPLLTVGVTSLFFGVAHAAADPGC